MSSAAPPHRLSSGVVVVSLTQRKLRFLLLRAYRNWDFPKGLVEAGEQPIDAALREVREETTLDDLSFDWGLNFMDTELGRPEHHEARWVDFARALTMVSPRLQPVVNWAHSIINHEIISKP
jgi:8-oxo-dGTP pyrophosphatase MutT (NUDIX family)